MVFYHNGKSYSSESAFLRQMRRFFASLPSQKRQSFKPITYNKTKQLKSTKVGNTKQIKDVDTKKITSVTLKAEKNKAGNYQLVKKQETYRVVNTLAEDPEGGTIYLSTADKAGSYVPANLDYEVEKLPGGIESTTGVNPKTKKNISSTTTSITPLTSEEVRKAQLLDDFMEWDKTKDPEKRLSTRELVDLASQLDLPTGFGKLKKPQVTFEARIREKLASQNVLSKKLQAEADWLEYQEQATLNQVEKDYVGYRTKALPLPKASERRIIAEAEEQAEAQKILKNVSKDRPDKKYNKEELAQGTKIEFEHTKNKEIAEAIAKDHLDEFAKEPLPNGSIPATGYYDELEEMEKELKKKNN